MESDVTYQDMDWLEVSKYLLRILHLFKSNELRWVKDDMFWDANHNYCAQMTLGYPIETIRETINLAKEEIPNVQIMTDVTYHNGLALMSSKHHKTILPSNILDQLLNQLGIKPDLPLKKGSILSSCVT